MKFRKSILILSVIVCTVIPNKIFAQQWYTEWGVITPPPEPPVDTPIDGGLSFLIAAGIGFGIKKMHAANKKNKQQ